MFQSLARERTDVFRNWNVKNNRKSWRSAGFFKSLRKVTRTSVKASPWRPISRGLASLCYLTKVKQFSFWDFLLARLFQSIIELIRSYYMFHRLSRKFALPVCSFVSRFITFEYFFIFFASSEYFLIFFTSFEYFFHFFVNINHDTSVSWYCFCHSDASFMYCINDVGTLVFFIHREFLFEYRNDPASSTILFRL